MRLRPNSSTPTATTMNGRREVNTFFLSFFPGLDIFVLHYYYFFNRNQYFFSFLKSNTITTSAILVKMPRFGLLFVFPKFNTVRGDCS